MKVNAVIFNEYGAAEDKLAVTETELPSVGPGEVRVRMLASPVHPADFNIVEGTYKVALERVIWNYGREQLVVDPEGQRQIPGAPGTPGGEGVGIVEESGDGAEGLLGKKVALFAGQTGVWQEQVVIPAANALPVPDGLSVEQAAMVFGNPITAYVLTQRILRVPEGEYVLQSAAASSLGQMVIRLGKQYGFKTINIVRSEAQRERLQALGADHVIVSESEDVIAAVARITDRKGVKCALDCVGGDMTPLLARCLGVNGHLVLFGTLSGPEFSVATRDLMTPNAKIEGFFLPQWLADQPAAEKLQVIREVSRLVSEGVLLSEIGEVFNVDQIREAVLAAKQRGRKGKIMLRFN